MGKGKREKENLSNYSVDHDNSPTSFGYVLLLSRLMYVMAFVVIETPPAFFFLPLLFFCEVFYVSKRFPAPSGNYQGHHHSLHPVLFWIWNCIIWTI
jgi:hypothetical protein